MPLSSEVEIAATRLKGSGILAIAPAPIVMTLGVVEACTVLGYLRRHRFRDGQMPIGLNYHTRFIERFQERQE